MEIDIQLLDMVASVTKKWPAHAQAIEDFCCDEWYRKGILRYMHTAYIRSKESITTRLYELDEENQDLVIRAIKHLGRHLCPLVRNIDLTEQDTNCQVRHR